MDCPSTAPAVEVVQVPGTSKPIASAGVALTVAAASFVSNSVGLGPPELQLPTKGRTKAPRTNPGNHPRGKRPAPKVVPIHK